MIFGLFPTWSLVLAHVVLQIAFILRVLLRPNREAASRIAWVLIILDVPALGMLAYVLFGETSIGRRRARRYKMETGMLRVAAPEFLGAGSFDLVDEDHRHLFRLGHAITGLKPVAGNRAELMPDSNAAVEALVADIDAATEHVHLLFYIWLADNNGLKVVEAAIRAAGRGVTVRAMADDLGSRSMIGSEHWQRMRTAGVELARALPLANPLRHPMAGRLDLRNHRKIMVIDNRITYCGSQNCADAEFRVKAKYAPWVDIMIRFEGPIAQQSQWLFAQDWMAHVDDDLRPLFAEPMPGTGDGLRAQVFGTGPTVRAMAMPEMFEAAMHSARHELVMTTPYYVPTEAMQSALCATARRGVRTILVLPARNDSWIVAAASHSYYQALLDAGVRIFEYPLGLLHAKSMVIDESVSLIGSANLDRRSLDLNYENNMLVEDAAFAATLKARQQVYIDASTEILRADVDRWSMARRLWNNSVATLGPVL